MPIYQFDCTVCGESTDDMMKYTEISTHKGFTCECGGHMKHVITACAIKPSVGGAHKGRITPPDVGPLSKKSKAYQKRNDEKNSKFYRPDQTFGQGSMKKFKDTKRKQGEMLSGKTNFTKDK